MSCRRHLCLGAFVTAPLFTVEPLMGSYLGCAAPTSARVAPGALLVLTFWMYCAGQIFPFGAVLIMAMMTSAARRAR